jgi:DnaK suppressor protein
MTADDRLEIRDYLAELLDDLLAREISVDVIHCPDENEYASRVSELNLNLALRERDSQRLRQVQAALGRVHDADFGVCADCGDPIGLPRLKAFPTAELCVHCQAQAEMLRRPEVIRAELARA